MSDPCHRVGEEALLLVIPAIGNANLLTNGSFEASTSTTITPTGWTQIGLEQGTVPYSMFPTMPIYDGLEFLRPRRHR